MNDFQSPYIEGQVIHPEEAEPNLRSFDSVQPVVVPEKKIQGCSKSASDCLQKTKQLAHEFNHGTYCTAHLVLAMTLIPNATRQFELRKVDIEKAFRAAMSALVEMERGSPNHRSVPRPSEELSVIVALAEEIAQNRDNQEVSVDDLLTAVDRMPPETSAAQLIRGERRNAQHQSLHNALEQFAANIGAQIRDLAESIRLSSQEQDLSAGRRIDELRNDLQMREGNLERTLAAQFADLRTQLTPPPPPPPQPAEPAPVTTVPPEPESDKSSPGIWGTILGNGRP
jgi:hypothetical protein